MSLSIIVFIGLQFFINSISGVQNPGGKSVKGNLTGSKESVNVSHKVVDPKKVTEKSDDEIIVTATKSKSKKLKSNRSISIITRKSIITKSPRTLPEALYETEGVFVQKTNHGGGSPIIRGFIGPRIGLTLDGVRLNNSLYRTGPNQYLNMWDPLFMNSIEVLRGSGSTLYGSGALGGVIGLYPRIPGFKQDNKFHLNAELSSSYETSDSGKAFYGSVSSFYNSIGVTGAFSLKRFSDLKGGGDVGVQPYSGYSQNSFMAGMVYRVNSELLGNWKIKLYYLGSILDNAGRTDKLESKHQLQVYDNSDHIIYLKFNGNIPHLKTKANFIVSWQNFFERKTNKLFNNDFTLFDSVSKSENLVNTLGFEGNFITSIVHKVINLKWGGSYYSDFVDSSKSDMDMVSGEWQKASSGDYPDSSRYSLWGVYGVADYNFLRSKESLFTFSLGTSLSGINATVLSHATLPKVNFKDHGWIYSGSMKYYLKNRANLAINLSQGFRAPNLQESAMLGDAGSFFHAPNYALSSEKSNTIEFVTKLKLSRLLKFTGSIYATKITGLISRRTTSWNGQTEIDGKDVVESYNANSGTMYGGDAGIILRLAKWKGKVLGGYVRGDEKTDLGEVNPMSKIPPLSGLFSVGRKFFINSHLSGNMELYFLGAAKQDRLSPTDIKDVRIPDGGTPGWWTANFRAYLTDYMVLIPKTKSTLTLIVNNIFNKKYKYHVSGIYSSGFNMLLSLNLKF